jgi:hypothetical protein
MNDSILIEEDSFFIGRSIHSNLTIKNDQLSRKHLHVKLHENVTYIMDLNTTNGTFLNNRKIIPSTWVSLIELDTIGFGHSDVCVQIIHENSKEINILPMKKKTIPKENYNHSITGFEGCAAVEIVEQAISPIDLSEYEASEKKRINAELELFSLKLQNKVKEEAKRILVKATTQAKSLTKESSELVEKNRLKINEQIDEQTNNSTLIKDLLIGKHNYEDQLDELFHSLEGTREQHTIEFSRLSALKKEHDLKSEEATTQIEELENTIVSLNNEYLSLLEKNDEIVIKMTETENRYNKLESEFINLRSRESVSYEKVEVLDQRIDKLYEKKDLVQDDLACLNNVIVNDKIIQNELVEQNQNLELSISKKKNELKNINSQISFEYQNKLDQYDEKISQLEESKIQEFDELICDAKLEAHQIIDDAQKISEDISVTTELELTEKVISSQSNISLLERDAEQLFKNAKIKSDEASEFENERIKELNQKQVDFIAKQSEMEIEFLADIEEKKTLCIVDINAQQITADEAVESLLSNAKRDAESIVSSANVEAKELLEKSHGRVVEMQTTSTLAVQSEKKSIELNIVELNSEIEDITKSRNLLTTELSTLRDNLDEERDKLLSQIADEKEVILNKANDDAASMLLEIKHNNELLVNQAKSESQKILEESKTQSQILKNDEEYQLKKLRDEEREMLAKLRAKEVQALNGLRLKTENEIKSHKKEHIQSIVLVIQNIINDQVLNNSSSLNIDKKIDSKLIGDLVRQSLLGERPQDSDVLKKLNPYGPGSGKSTKLMKRLIITFAVIFTVLLIHMIFPQIYNGILDFSQNAISVERSAQDMYKEGIQLKRENAPKYEPEMSSNFKESYVDNILHTTNYASLWLSDDFQKQWTIKIDEVLVYKFKLSDYKVIQYISLEFKLVRDLEELRGKITLKNQDDIIRDMNELEEISIQKIENLVEGEENLEKLLLIQQGFYTDYLN